MSANKYTDEEKQFLFDTIPGRLTSEVAELFNARFETVITQGKVKAFMANHKITSGVNCEFKKGQVSFNKGKKQYEYMSKEGIEKSSETRFKKGNVPPNRRELGDERIAKDGYIEVKVADGSLNDNWAYKQRAIYEDEHGPIPEGAKVIFADGNKLNFDINNLVLVTSEELLIMNQHGLYTKDSDLTKTGTTIAKVIATANKKRRKT